MNTLYDKNNAEAYLGATALALQEALEASVMMLAEAKGTEDLSWFDDLHQETLSSAQRMVIEEVTVEVDAGARRFALEVLDARFKSLRISLVEEKE